MEIKKLQNLLIESSGERQQHAHPPVPKEASFGNRLRDTADSFEALLSRTSIPASSDVTQSLYMAQMQAQKNALLDEYASTLGRLSHDFSRQLGTTGLHLSEIIEHAETPGSLTQLLAPLTATSRQQAEQFIQTHQVQIHSLKLKNREIQNFPPTLSAWLNQQHLLPTTGPASTAATPQPQDDASRYQQISQQYQQHLTGLKAAYNDAANALLLEAQRSLPVDNISLAELVRALEQPQSATGTDNFITSPLQQWLREQQPLAEQFLQQRQASNNIPSMADWARQNGMTHPWLHS
ncbi:MAG: hypothetical protein OIF57_11360 [Marinobacterium sp.]|nr:hypothetical protein [Marinobacterium sp.]